MILSADFPSSKVRLLLLASIALASPLAYAQNSGVAHPPSDDAIVANDDPAPAPVAAPAKPLPGVPAAAGTAPPARAVENPDYGIVTSTADTQPARAPEPTAHLIARPTNPDYGVVGMVPSPSNQLAEGTDIHVRLLDALSTDRTQDGQPFRA